MSKKLSFYMALALAVISLPAQAGYRDRVLADWPLSYWEFEDPASYNGTPCADTMCDYYPSCSPGVYINCGSGPDIELVPGLVGQAAKFHGTSDGNCNFVQIHDSNYTDPPRRLSSSPSCSMELLIKAGTTESETYARIYTHADGGTTNYLLGMTTDVNSANPGQLFVGVPGGTWFAGPPILADDNWHHVVVTYTYNDPNTTTELWIDGISRGTHTVTGVLTPAGDYLMLGAEGSPYFALYGYQGHIDDIAYFDYALSPFQIKSHFFPLYYPGDINSDGKVDFKDFAELGSGWLTIYDFDKLAEIAYYWLVEDY